MSIRSVTSVRAVNTNRSAKQFARGHRGGILATSMPRVCQDRVERRRELSGAIADQEPEPRGMVAQVHDEVARLLRGPRACGCPKRRNLPLTSSFAGVASTA